MRKWMFIFEKVLPDDMGNDCFPSGDDSWNPMCLVNARINIRKNAFLKISVAIVPNNYAADEGGEIEDRKGACPKYLQNLKMGESDALNTYRVLGKAMVARQCAFVDFTKENIKAFVQGKVSLVVFAEVKGFVRNSNIHNIAPFITTDLADMKAISSEHCQAAINYRKKAKFL